MLCLSGLELYSRWVPLPCVKLKHVSPCLKFDPFQELVIKCDIINENLCNIFINYQHYQT